ncbi:MAG TPA: DUF1553 domain-containing protein [Tepidisphaeraceae bacterium]|jgi:hypothetical protein|nr:DUF1553 domain-containing protein [Tepidisphaeraceae bacterium]
MRQREAEKHRSRPFRLPPTPGVFFVLWITSFHGLSATGTALGDVPLHDRIDRMIAANAGGPVAPPAGDAEFLRRVYLDLAGHVPSSADARLFLADTAPDKREKLIDALLAGPDYPRRMADAFDVMLMERRLRGDTPWHKYLETSFAADKHWDDLTREILCPDAENPGTRASAFFYVKRLEQTGANPVDYPLLTRDIGRLFLGVDLKCAQCHNHKYIKDYKQVDFQGLLAFVGQTFIRRDVKGGPAIGEKPLVKKIDYVSVFHPSDKFETGPRVPFGTEMQMPSLKKGEEWAQKPDPRTKFPGVPKFDTLRLLADQTARADNEKFKQNIVNRLWFLMMGRGLVNPLDLSNSENPPSHPALLNLLAEKFANSRFDIKSFIRELALTRIYQRTSLLSGDNATAPPESYRVANAKRMSAEQIAQSMLVATAQLEAVRAIKEQKVKPVAVDPTADAAPPEEKAMASSARVPLNVVYQKFVAAFGSPAGEAEVEFAPSVAGALFVSNEKFILAWLQPEPGNLAGKLSKIDDPKALADELYLSVLTRSPTDDERADVAAFLTKHAAERDKAIGEMEWALLASTEFCVNH